MASLSGVVHLIANEREDVLNVLNTDFFWLFWFDANFEEYFSIRIHLTSIVEIRGEST